MELNAEINRVFGEEMAEVFAQTISEDEIKNLATTAWNEMKSSRSYYTSKAQEVVMAALKIRLVDAVRQLSETEAFQEDMKRLASEIVSEIIETTHKKMVEDVSNRIAGLATGHNGRTIQDHVESYIREVMQR